MATFCSFYGWVVFHQVTTSWTRLSDFTFTLHFHTLEKEMAAHSSVLGESWRIPGTGEPGGLQSMGSHRVGHDWSDLAAAAAACLSTTGKREDSEMLQWFTEFFLQGLPFCLECQCFPSPSYFFLLFVLSLFPLPPPFFSLHFSFASSFPSPSLSLSFPSFFPFFLSSLVFSLLKNIVSAVL